LLVSRIIISPWFVKFPNCASLHTAQEDTVNTASQSEQSPVSYLNKLLRFQNSRGILLFVKTLFSSYLSESLSVLLGMEGCG
jgi:hypothetical protein